VLLAVAVAAVALTLVVRAPERPRTGLYAVTGTRLLRVPRHAVQGVVVTLGPGRLDARRGPEGWTVDGRPAAPELARALDDLVDTLVHLRAVDAFRGEVQAGFELDPPRGTIDLLTPRGRRRLVLGGLNGAGTAVYARRDGDRRTFLVGTYLLSQLETALHRRDAATAAAAH